MEVEVQGGPVWQWDIGRYVSISGCGQVQAVDMAVRGAVMSVTVAVERGRAPIPNELLQDGADIHVWAKVGERTVGIAHIPVRRRPKPDDYVYVVTPTLGYASLREEMLAKFEELRDEVSFIRSVEEPLFVKDGGVLGIDMAKRGTRITVGDEPPADAVPGDSHIRQSDFALLVAQEV